MSEDVKTIDEDLNYWEGKLKGMAEKYNALPQEVKDKHAKESAERDERTRSDRVSRIVKESKAPKRHLANQSIKSPADWGASCAKLVGKLGSGFLVALVGGRGTGKTQLGVELIKSRANDFHRSRYCTAFEFFMEVKAGYNADGETEKAVIESFQECGLLVIDEVGKRSETEWENRLLYELLNRRYNDMKDTLLISNQESSALEAALGDSLVSRMRETGGIIECNWQSFRQ